MKFRVDKEIILTGAPVRLQRELKAYFTMANPAYIEAEKMGRYTGDLEQSLCFCDELKDQLHLPRGAARDALVISQQYGEVEIIDNRLSLPEISLTFRGILRPYQHQAVGGVLAKEFGVLESGTGSGKTTMALAMIAARRQPTIILVHTKELLYQWQARIKQFLGLESGLIGDGKFDMKPLTVAIVNSARNRLADLSNQFGHVVVDECHRVPASMFTETVTAFPARYMTGLTATPFRRDGLDKLIGWYLGLHRIQVSMATLHEVGAVLRPKIVNRETDFHYFYEDDYQTMVSALVEDQNRNAIICADIRKQSAQGGLALVVSDRVAHLKTLAEMTGVAHHLLTGKTSAKKRQAIVASLAGGEVPILFSTLSLIGEGFDCPSMDSLFLASPIKFDGRLKQVVGRVLRPAEGKQPIVYDYCDARVGLLHHQWKSRQKVFQSMQ